MAQPEVPEGKLQVVLGGDHADPSIVRDGEDFYLTHSSYDKHPGLKIWHSRNLVDWKPIGYALHRNVGSVWAPDFIKHGDTFFIYFPTSTGDNYVVTAANPAGPWSDPIKLNVSGIDPGHVTAPDGERLIYLNGGKLARLSPDGLTVTADAVKRYDGWPIPQVWDIECFCLESPKLLRRGDYYYLTSAQGGTAGPPTSHMVVTARSRSPQGPWEESPYNPVVHTWSRDEEIWSKGHGTFFDDAAGNWYVIYHGYLRGQLAWGRHVVIETVEWTDDGWPRTHRNPVQEGELSYHNNERIRSDGFEGDRPGRQWQFGGLTAPFDQVTVTGGSMVLQPAGGQIITAQVNPDGKTFEIAIEIEVEGRDTIGGLGIYYSDTHHVGLGLHDGEVVRLINGRTAPEPQSVDQPRHLKVRVRNDVATFYSSADGRSWIKADRSYELSGFQHNSLGGFSYLRPVILARGPGIVRVARFDFVDGR
ncbi:MAG: family 43 glycosylhydrolase [Opitutaceae bacterium]